MREQEDIMSRRGLAEVRLIVPLGVEAAIFPWGVNLIADYVRAARPTDVEVIDLARHPSVRKIVDGNQDLFKELRGALTAAGHKSFSNAGPAVSGYDDTFAGVLLWLGGRFIDVAAEERMYSPLRSRSWLNDRRARLEELRLEHEGVLEGLLKGCTSDPAGALFGISTYDHTVFYVLQLSRMIRRLSPPSAVILGGDFWDFRTSREVVTKLSWLDGVCVGFGENVIIELLDARSAGKPLNDLLLKGFMNQALVARDSHVANLFVKPKDLADKSPDKLQTFNVPETYLQGNGATYRLVHDHPLAQAAGSGGGKEILVRVLTKRGCSYSACKFCTQIDRFLNFPFAMEDTIAQLTARLTAAKPDETLHLIIDNDELDVGELLRLIDVLEEHPTRWSSVLFWYQVKRFSPAVADALAASHDPSKYLFVMNWESLNPLTLKHMAKGHSVLGGIEAAKAVMDAGGEWASNLMGIFPGQTLESVAEEARFITSAMHLIKKAKSFSFFPYCANSRDEVAGNADRFQMTTKQEKNIWPRTAFDVDLTLSLFEWTWTDSREGPEGDLARAWHDMMNGEASLIGTAARLLYHSIRAKDYCYLERLMALRLSSLWKAPFKVGRGTSPVLELKGEELRIREAGLFARERRVRLSKVEIALLRDAYFVRKVAELTASLARELTLPEREIEELINKHVKMGTLVLHKGQVVSSVCDPAYLRQRQAARKMAARRPAEPPLVSVKSLVRQAAA